MKASLYILLWKKTESPFLLSLLTFFDMAPSLLIGIWSSVMVDRLSAPYLLIRTQALSSLMCMALFVCFHVFPGEIHYIFLIFIINGCIGALSQPARQAILSHISGRDGVHRFSSIQGTLFHLSGLIAMVITYFAETNAQIGALILLNAASYIAIVLFLALRVNAGIQPAADLQTHIKSPFAVEVTDAYNYIRTRRELGTSIVLLLIFSTLIRPIFELVPILASSFFPDSMPVSKVYITVSFGMLAGSLASARWKSLEPSLTIVSLILLFFCFCMMEISNSLLIKIVFCLISASLVSFTITNRVAVLQKLCAMQYIGRVVGLESVLRRATIAIGVLFYGICLGSFSFFLLISTSIFIAVILSWLLLDARIRKSGVDG
ncbi:MFS transporter [Rhizobium laguerreae]|nr:MFS transporter [Rhizobium laguerreae]MBY3447034.1 MFS transporter [Rhizobium laguerreae]